MSNIIAILIAVGLVLATRMDLVKRLVIVALLLSYPVVLRYVFTFMTEPYHVLFAVTATLFMLKLYEAEPGSQRFQMLLTGFVVLLLTLSVFRITYALWTLALIQSLVHEPNCIGRSPSSRSAWYQDLCSSCYSLHRIHTGFSRD